MNKPFSIIITQIIRLAILLSICSAANYICGILWFVFVYTDGGIGAIPYALAVMVLPFVIPDAIKIFLTVITSERIKRHVYKKIS
jgi:biotin transporter BioY